MGIVCDCCACCVASLPGSTLILQATKAGVEPGNTIAPANSSHCKSCCKVFCTVVDNPASAWYSIQWPGFHPDFFSIAARYNLGVRPEHYASSGYHW